MAFLGLLLAILLSSHGRNAPDLGHHHVVSSPLDTWGEATGG